MNCLVKPARSGLLLAAALVLLSAAARAEGQQITPAQKQEMKLHYERATRAYDVGKYQEAIEEYQKAYEIGGDPPMLYNIAQAYRLSSEKALTYYKKFLAIHPNAPNRAEVEKQIALLTQKLSEDKPAVIPAPVPPLEIKRPKFMEKPAVVEPTPAPAQLVAAPPEKKRDSVARRGWFWVGMTTMAAAVAVGVGVGVTYGTKPSSPDPTFGIARGNIALIGRAH